MRSRLCLVLALAPFALPAWAQELPNSNVRLNAPGLIPQKPKPGPPDVKASPQAWPRLDPGATLCRSDDDLTRLAARQSGDANAGPVDCQIIRTATAIQIVQRAGPGRTQVRLTDKPAVTGWTNAWLPEKAPGPR